MKLTSPFFILFFLSDDENTPEKRVARIFDKMDANNDGRLTMEEFMVGSKEDPSIIQALSLYADAMEESLY